VKVEHKNPEGLADPSIAEHVNPALEAGAKALAEGLLAAGEADAAFVMLVFTSTDTLRIASNLEPDSVKALLKSVANEGQNVLPMDMAFAMINTVCRLAKLREMTPADFIVLMKKVADVKAGSIITH
jgi:hypothetical protein